MNGNLSRPAAVAFVATALLLGLVLSLLDAPLWLAAIFLMALVVSAVIFVLRPRRRATDAPE